MSVTVVKLVRAGFTEQQASALEEIFPEVIRSDSVASDNLYRVVSKPIEVIVASAVAASCTTTAVDEILASFTISSGQLGLNSILQIEPLWAFTSSANNKIIKVKVGGTTVYTATRTTSVKESPLVVLANRNSLSSQIQPYDSSYTTAGAGTPATYTLDLSGAVAVQITGQRANSGDALTLEYFRCLHFVGD